MIQDKIIDIGDSRFIVEFESEDGEITAVFAQIYDGEKWDEIVPESLQELIIYEHAKVNGE